MFFIVVMIASLAAVGFAPNSGGRNRTVDDLEPPEETPAAAVSFSEPAKTIDSKTPHLAVLKTSAGDITINLATDAPLAVNSFAFLAGKGFYDGTAFFFVDRQFVAQAGDPTCRADAKITCSGVGGPGYTLKVEKTKVGHSQWAVVAPSLGPGQDVHGSQFRILFQADQRLDGDETVFGMVTDAESQRILAEIGEIAPCSLSNATDCATDLKSALVIEEVIVQPA